jgi:hypothetical protein
MPSTAMTATPNLEFGDPAPKSDGMPMYWAPAAMPTREAVR